MNSANERSSSGRWCRTAEHAGGDVGADRRLDDARLHQVEREVAGARADLQRARERAGTPAEQLLDLAEHLRAADVAEVDAPLRVVVGRRDVVVAAVDVEDLVGREAKPVTSGARQGRGHPAASLGLLIPSPARARTRRAGAGR
jgi:hypothetical protein